MNNIENRKKNKNQILKKVERTGLDFREQEKKKDAVSRRRARSVNEYNYREGEKYRPDVQEKKRKHAT